MTKEDPDNSLVNHTADFFFFFYINVPGSASSSPDAINYPSLKAPVQTGPDQCNRDTVCLCGHAETQTNDRPFERLQAPSIVTLQLWMSDV